jgi:sugar phosphate isomerase/epimerase
VGIGLNDVLNRLAMSEVTTFNWTIDDDVAAYARHGFPGIEIWLNKVARNGAAYDTLPADELSAEVAAALARDLREAGLTAASIVCAGGLTDPDPEVWEARIAHLRVTIRFAAQIGASCVLVVPGDLGDFSRPEAIERTVLALRAGIQDAHDHSIDLAIEPLRPIHTDFVNTLPQALEIVAAVDDPRCGVCMDTFQVWRGDGERDAVIAEIVEAAPHTQIVQVADSRPKPRSKEDRLVPGEGVLPLVEMLRVVFASGYDGWLAVEIMSTELWKSDYDSLLERCSLGMRTILEQALATNEP